MRTRRALPGVALGAALVAALVAGGLVAPGPTSAAAAAGPDPLFLVTLEGTGTAGRSQVVGEAGADRMHRRQDAVLATVGADAPVYRWTTALDGVAVHLTRQQVVTLRNDPRVALVERDAVQPLTARTAAGAVSALSRRDRGGAGVVIGVVDSGLWPDSPVFSAVPGLGRQPRAFRGACQAGERWPATTCNGKVVGARWFVDGFGVDRLRSSSSLSPLDDDGHGTQIASIAAGDAGVTARVRGQRLGTYGGVAPQARLAVYKACWTAPDPDDDGCSTADLVAAIDAATADGVDVLNLSVGRSHGFDTVERALLGATEGGVTVVGTAGNAGRRVAAHPSPWVTTAGATTGAVRRGRVLLAGGPTLVGAMAASRSVGPARLVRGADVPAADAARAAARVCTPGSLDAGRVAGRVVLCERGVVARVDKSAAVALADGVGMVLANVGPGNRVADFHSVPTVHLDRAGGRAVGRWLAAHPRGRVRLAPLGQERLPVRVTGWSSPGDPGGAVVKPDVVATGVGVLGGVPPRDDGILWDLASGTSAATAVTSGVAALLVARHPDWSPAAIRSALATTARRVPGAPALRAGAGRVSARAVVRPGLVYDVGRRDYRSWLAGTLRHDLNTPSVLLTHEADTTTRRITNVTGRRLYFSAAATGFTRHDVRVTPAAVRLGPGRSATFTIAVGRTAVPQPDDDGWITWRGATGTVTRIPVVIAR